MCCSILGGFDHRPFFNEWYKVYLLMEIDTHEYEKFKYRHC